MYIPKRYGESKISKCPFCGKDAFSLNSQKIPTCKDHKETTLDNVKCLCGRLLDMREGKFGIFFTCLHCGAMSIKKVLEIVTMTKENSKPLEVPPKSVFVVNDTNEMSASISMKKTDFVKKKEVTIRSDDPDFF